MPDWKIFYADGSSFSSDEGEPHEAPQDGFICAVGYAKAGRRYITHGKNHYFWNAEDGEWWGVDWHGVLDRLRMCASDTDNPMPAYKEGRMAGEELFKSIMTRAHRDPDFPQRG